MPASATVINSYDFSDGFSDTLGNGLDLIASGGVLSGGRYTFGGTQGLRLDSALLNPFDYTIEIKFKFNTLAPYYKKVLDYQSLSSDSGLYFTGDRMEFFNITGGGPTPILGDTDYVSRVTRNGGTNYVQGFIDDVLQWSFNDTNNIAVSGGNIFNFFEDDFTTGQSESSTGSVDWIRISDNTVTVPEPSTIALLVLGLFGVGFMRRNSP